MHIKFIFLLIFFGLLAAASSRYSPEPAARQDSLVPFGTVPTPRQLAWHELEVIGMVNFSTITYYGREWGYGDEEAAKFNPTGFDAKQIICSAKAGEIKGLVIDAKHHGGFCLWPSKYNDSYSVKNSPWRNGKGDMVRELVDACRAEDIQVGMYLSPWDRNRADYGKPEYVEYFHNQLRELLTEYGPVFEIWFDGANGGDGWYGGAKESRKIDRRTYYQFEKIIPMVRQLQPGACIFSDIGPEIRWCGNESGFSGDPCWATFTPKYRNSEKELKIDPQTGIYTDFPLGETNYSEATNGNRNGNYWIPAECDFPLRKGWFWHPEGHGRHTPAQLVDLYFRSVGHNSTMDIGIAPDRRGLIDEYDEKLLREFGERIKAIFETNLALKAKVLASNVRGKSKAYAAQNAISGKSKFNQYWAASDEIRDAELVLDFGKATEFSVVSLREPIQFGHRIDRWALDAWKDGKWTEFVSGNAIGARRLWRGQPITSTKIRLRITNAMASPAISEFAVYLERESSRKESKSVSPLFNQGMDNTNWTISSPNGKVSEVKKAIDNNPSTFCFESKNEKKQQEIVVDMGKSAQVKGFLYTPRQDHQSAGTVTHYSFSVSPNGKEWTEVSRGEFSNIEALPVQQKIEFEKPRQARFFKFTALAALSGGFNIAEIGIINQ